MPRLRPWVTIYAIPLLVLVVLAAASPAFLGNDFEGLTISPPSDHGGQTAAGDDDYEDFVDYGTIPHLVSRIKVSNYSRGFRFDVLNSDPLVGFEFNIVSHPPNATIVASNGPLSVLAGFLLNYDVDIQKVVGWSPLEEAMEATTGQSDYRALAYFETDTKGTYCIGHALLVSSGVAKIDSVFETDAANCTEVET